MALHSQNFISLFAGAGGLDLALGLAVPDARCICYVEREIEAAEILAARIADEALDDAPIWSDVTNFDGKPWRGLVDGITGGFPCQDLSVAGKQKGFFACSECGVSSEGPDGTACGECGGGVTTTRSGLWFEYVRIIREVEPRWVYIENVDAVLAFPAGGIVLGELARLGFDAEWGTVRASGVGASHQRKRRFILAYRHGTRKPQLSRIVREQWSGIGDSGHGVGNADDARLERWRYISGRRGSEWSSGAAGCELEFSNRAGCGDSIGLHAAITPSNESIHGLSRSTSSYVDSPDRAVFAPGPRDSIWGEVLVRDYELRPALAQAEAESIVCGVADGVANPLDQRIDRLRACGNGVVAIQGAAAFIELVRRASL
ncbi:DNA cytosine methyltransferase [Edaphobacter albus]|uniref:DNA cytosine methyltransferase n=1 Tax=Edaphobacter sp. 4G125 TaxID=2763071 RepID=UPI0016447668|nr:DNA cytosine methyltransferase [Edaphobacter sp. 4G125]QNI37508.1 DNA cytosine methyltransferase [Edaphobacter sp. 4G125]